MSKLWYTDEETGKTMVRLDLDTAGELGTYAVLAVASFVATHYGYKAAKWGGKKVGKGLTAAYKRIALQFKTPEPSPAFTHLEGLLVPSLEVWSVGDLPTCAERTFTAAGGTKKTLVINRVSSKAADQIVVKNERGYDPTSVLTPYEIRTLGKKVTALLAELVRLHSLTKLPVPEVATGSLIGRSTCSGEKPCSSHDIPVPTKAAIEIIRFGSRYQVYIITQTESAGAFYLNYRLVAMTDDYQMATLSRLVNLLGMNNGDGKEVTFAVLPSGTKPSDVNSLRGQQHVTIRPEKSA